MFTNFLFLFASSLIVSGHIEPPKDCQWVGEDGHKTYVCKDNEDNFVELSFSNETDNIHCRFQENVFLPPKRWWLQLLQGIDFRRATSNIKRLEITSCSIVDAGIIELSQKSWVKEVTELNISHSPLNEEDFLVEENRQVVFPVSLLQGFSNLKTLSLHDNYLDKIPVKSFETIPQIEILDLHQNHLTRLEDDTFRHQSKLQTLILRDNKFSKFDRQQLFVPLRELTHLDLSSNRIRVLGAQVFQTLSKLQYLNLDVNKISILPEGGLLSNLSMLNYFSIEKNNLSSVPSDIFRGMINLTYINFKSNALKFLPEDIFEDTKNLTELCLGHNQLDFLPYNIFHTTACLKTIILNNNNLIFESNASRAPLYMQDSVVVQMKIFYYGICEKEMFKEAKHLRKLDLSMNYLIFNVNGFMLVSPELEEIDLSNNKFLSLKESTFYRSQNLLTLRLRNCKFHSIDRSTFKHLIQLRIIDLSRNYLKEIPIDLFQTTIDLEEIDLSYNVLEKLDGSIFCGLLKLAVLRLEGNNMKFMDGHIFMDAVNLRTVILGKNPLATIPVELFNVSKKLENIDLNFNNFQEISKTMLWHLEKLAVLNLTLTNVPDKMVISEQALPEDFFRRTNKLEVIDLSHLRLSSVGDKLFSGLHKLSTLRLHSNRLFSISGCTFNDVPNLRIIDLSNNYFKELPQDLFHKCREIEEIYLDHNYLVTLDKNIFYGLQKLNYLIIDGNDSPPIANIEEFHSTLNKSPNVTISSISHPNFKELFYFHEGNKSRSIDRTPLWNFRQLSKLDLAFNRMIIDEYSFKGLVNLKIIKLPGNKYEKLPGNLFQMCRRLETIDLSFNELTTVNRTLFRGLRKLSNLYLLRNKLTSVEMSLFLPFDSLETLKTITSRSNDIDLIDEYVSTLYIDLSFNNLSKIYLQEYEHLEERLLALVEYSPELQSYRRILEVSFEYNPIRCDCQNLDFLQLIQYKMNRTLYGSLHLKKTQNLRCDSPQNLPYKEITSLNLKNLTWSVEDNLENCSCQPPEDRSGTIIKCAKLPERLPNVTQAEINFSHIGSINLTEVSRLINSTRVTKLSLSGNALDNIDDLKIPLSLRELELDNNNMTTLSEKSLEMLNRSDLTLSLHNNPWKCDCDSVKDFRNFLMYSKSKIKPGMFFCGKIQNAAIDVPSEEELCYAYKRVLYPALAIFAALFLVVTLNILYYKYRYEIKVFLYARRICSCLVTEEETDRNKEYDAFISYCHQDEDFVAKHLVPGLENGPYPYKVCLHYRNWIPGELISEQIVKSIGSSRRTIIVLSRNYLESRWGNMEFRTAYIKGLQEDRSIVILVLLEDLDPNENLMSPELKAHITLRTYLKWDDSNFWNKLRYALPHCSQTRSEGELTREEQKTHRTIIEEFNVRELDVDDMSLHSIS